MGEPVIAERRLLVRQILLGEEHGEGALMLRNPVLIEAGQRYWVEDCDLVVVSADGRRSTFPGDRGSRCYTRGEADVQKPYQGVVWIGDEPGERVAFMAGDATEAAAWIRATFGEGVAYTVHNEDDANRPR